MTSSKDFMDEDERRLHRARIPGYGRPMRFDREVWAEVKLKEFGKKKRRKRKKVKP